MKVFAVPYGRLKTVGTVPLPRNGAPPRGAVGAAQARAAQTRREATSRLGLLQMPVLVFWGEEDALAPVSVGRTLAEDLPRAQFHVIKDCGHLPTLEQQGEADAILGKFLRDKHPRAE